MAGLAFCEDGHIEIVYVSTHQCPVCEARADTELMEAAKDAVDKLERLAKQLNEAMEVKRATLGGGVDQSAEYNRLVEFQAVFAIHDMVRWTAVVEEVVNDVSDALEPGA